MLPRPVPYLESDFAPRCPRAHDPFEDFLPSRPGFIRDFVLGLWNSEAPVAYAAWAAVWALAMTIKREAWVRWFKDDPLYPNFYIILSGPPSTKKGKAIGRAVRVYKAGIGPMEKPLKGESSRGYPGLITERWVRDMKTHVPLILDFSTTRPLKAALSWRGRRTMGSEHGLEFVLKSNSGDPLLDEYDEPWVYQKTSEIGVVTEELSTFLGKQKYNEGLVPLMLAIYNTDLDKEDRTDVHGVVSMRSLCTNWLAGTTADSFQDTVSDTAKGDGFFSRATIVHQDRRWQRFFPPPAWDFLPGVQDLGTRLAYVAETTFGEHVLTEEALKLAQTWYTRHVESIESQVEYAHFWSRKDVQLLKLALIMKAQRYPDPDDLDITKDDLEDAIRLLDATARFAPRIMEARPVSLKMRDMQRVASCIGGRGEKGITRAYLQASTRLGLDILDPALSELQAFGKITVRLDGDLQDFIPGKSKEVYTWVGRVGEDGKAILRSGPAETEPGSQAKPRRGRRTKEVRL